MHSRQLGDGHTDFVIAGVAMVDRRYLGPPEPGPYVNDSSDISEKIKLHCLEIPGCSAGWMNNPYNLKQDSGWTGETDHSLGKGSFTITSTNLGGADYRLISTGTVNDQSRMVQQDVSLGASLTLKTNTWKEQ